MTRYRCVDLFCGAGGMTAGYLAAGLDVVGVDLARRAGYPAPLILADALTFPLDGFDLVHASPPCKPFTPMSNRQRGQFPRLFDVDVDLLTPMLERLRAAGVPWVVENVVGAPMPPDAVTYCATAFGLPLRRHRLFAASFPLAPPAPCRHTGLELGLYGNGPGRRLWTRADGSELRCATLDEARAAIGLPAADWGGLTQAIPAAMGEHVGRQAIAYLNTRS